MKNIINNKEQCTDELEKQLRKQEELIQELNKKNIQLQRRLDSYLNSPTYKIGDAVLSGIKPSKYTFIMLSHIIRLILEEWKRRKKTWVVDEQEMQKTYIQKKQLGQGKKSILYVIHESGGGTPKTNEDLMKVIYKQGYNTYVLTSSPKHLCLYYYTVDSFEVQETYSIEKCIKIDEFYNDTFAKAYLEILQKYHIDLIHIRHLFGHTFDIVNEANKVKIPVILSLHDFYFICPTINLINTKGIFCEGKCTKAKGICGKHKRLAHQYGWIHHIWRQQVREMMSKCELFITTSNYARNLYQSIYPDIIKNNICVIEHGRDFHYEPIEAMAFKNPNKIKILLPGIIHFHKGSQLISKIIELDKDNKLEFHLIGGADTILKRKIYDNKIYYHGNYSREEFKNLVEYIKPNFIGIFSIWPETYCHTLTEALSVGIPTIVSDIGTLKERAQNNGCILIDYTNPSIAYEQIIKAFEDNIYKELCKEVKQNKFKTVLQMGEEYLEQYKKVLDI